MSTTVTRALAGNSRRHAMFVAFIVISSLAFYKTLSAVIRYSLASSDSGSHIVLVPMISFFLLYLERKRIFSITRPSIVPGANLALLAIFLYWLANRSSFPLEVNWQLSLETLCVVLIWIAGFLLCYGFAALRAAAFPLLFLLLMVPLPDVILDRAIYALQSGSTEISYLIFQLVGTPVSRNGFLLSVPGVTIEVAKECSSIRSSIALFITCLLAAHLYLRTAWKRFVFVVLGLLLSVVKNGIRITTLTLLSIYVDPGFLSGRLHKQGGFVFFLIALLILLPVFLWMEKTDKLRKPGSSPTRE
ncbi:MAG: exosortase/archaeosortase family protein [Candidatus Acidiferrales bacterium]